MPYHLIISRPHSSSYPRPLKHMPSPLDQYRSRHTDLVACRYPVSIIIVLVDYHRSCTTLQPLMDSLRSSTRPFITIRGSIEGFFTATRRFAVSGESRPHPFPCETKHPFDPVKASVSPYPPPCR
jgi:hypothetical protein